jgi:hypothetical protein
MRAGQCGAKRPASIACRGLDPNVFGESIALDEQVDYVVSFPRPLSSGEAALLRGGAEAAH